VETTRRDLVLIAGGTLTAALLSWLVADPAASGQITSRRRIGEAAVRRIEERARTLRRMDDEDGGGTILTEASSALSLTVTLIRDRTYNDAHGTRLYATASDLARQRAAALFDVRGECADGAYETALRAAKAAGDDALGANCLAFWASSAYNTGRLRDAEAMADAALAAIRGRTVPRVEAMLRSRRGRARAHLGRYQMLGRFRSRRKPAGKGRRAREPGLGLLVRPSRDLRSPSLQPPRPERIWPGRGWLRRRSRNFSTPLSSVRRRYISRARPSRRLNKAM
jgi:hypothetical protein